MAEIVQNSHELEVTNLDNSSKNGNNNSNNNVVNQSKSKKRSVTSNKIIMSICISAMMIALAVVFEFVMKFIPFLSMPQGGHISLAILPLVILALVCGPVYGTIGGVIFALINFFIDGGAGAGFSIWSFFLDYILAFGSYGLVGFFHTLMYSKKNYWIYFVAIIIASLGRYLSSGLSGALIFGMYAPEGVNPWFYSFILYNLGYIGVSLILSLILVPFLIKPINKILNNKNFECLKPYKLILKEDNSK